MYRPGWMPAFPIGPTMSLRLATASIALLLCAIAMLYASTLHQLWTVWWSGEAYQVPALVPWVSLAFVWHGRTRYASMSPQPSARYLPLVALSVLAWAIAHAAFVALGEFIALVAMVHAVLLAVLGSQMYRALRFPLWLLWLAVPVGDDLFPPLVQLTVRLSEWGLTLTGTHASVEGSMLVTGQGRYGVIQECTSLPFIIGNLVASLVFAWLAYDRPFKRIAYVLCGVVLAVFANIVRIILVIRITELSDRRIDLASDHAMFGWTLFLLMMALQLWIGARWCDPARPGQPPTQAPLARGAAAGTAGLGVLASALLILSGPHWLGVGSWADAEIAARDAQCKQPLAGFESVGNPPWSPMLSKADAIYRGLAVVEAYPVDVVAGVFEAQAPGREVVGWETRSHDGKSFILLEHVSLAEWSRPPWPVPLDRKSVV